MKRIRVPMHRYGEADFDKEYINWGLHDRDTQIREAESLSRLLAKKCCILDLACGIGTHAIHWAKNGHAVTAVDLSETFIGKGKELAEGEGVYVEFIMSDVEKLNCQRRFDVVTWIEHSFFHEEMVEKVFSLLKEDGRFVFDDRNPEHPKVGDRQKDWRTWKEADGVFYLEKHETNPETGAHEDSWVKIDTQSGIVEEKFGVNPTPLALHEKIDLLRQNGFSGVHLRTMDGDIHENGSDPYWLWVIAEK